MTASVAAEDRRRPAGDPESGTLAGSVERVTYHSAETGFCVLRVDARGHRNPVTVVGHAPAIQAGAFVEASGAWVNDRTYGVQFRAEELSSSAPTTLDGLETYLGSGLIHGVGPVFARKLVDRFGEEVMGVIEREPERLRAVEGVGPWRARQIVQALVEQRALRDITLFLHGHGVSAARAVRIYKTFGPRALEVIAQDPYRLAREVRGIGFPAADRIAERLGVEKGAPPRLRAGLAHALTEALADGHCGLPVHDLVLRAGRLLGDVSLRSVEAAVDDAARRGDLVLDAVGAARCAFLAGLHAAEEAIARRLARLARAPLPWDAALDLDDALRRAEAHMGVTLAESQRAAMRLALRSKVLVVTGGPGTGKTTIVNGLLHVLREQAGVAVALAAPTGRAAKRLSESTGLEARTLHRLLEVDAFAGGFRRGPGTPLDGDLLVVDEASMVDVRLMHALLRALPDRAALVLVGDVDQLPSIGPGQVLADVIGSGAVPVVRLTEIFRQAAESRIVASAHAINRGERPDLRPQEGSDFYFVEAEEPEEGLRKLVALVRDRIPKRFGLDPVRDVQVLAPMNRGPLGVRALNLTLQEALNPEPADRIERFGTAFATGDKVMQVQNAYERDVYNGDVGVVLAVDRAAETLTVGFDGGREVAYGFGELDELVLAYATTIHKAQGSEFPAVVLPLTMQHALMLRRNLLYTGVTRGRRLVVLVGAREALDLAIRDEGAARRWSRLKGRLAAEMERCAAAA